MWSDGAMNNSEVQRITSTATETVVQSSELMFFVLCAWRETVSG